jgi:hypothetical protein
MATWLDNIRQKPHEKKVRLIWICVAVAVILLFTIWAATWHYRKNVPRDTTLFDTIERGVNDYKQNYNKPIQ